MKLLPIVFLSLIFSQTAYAREAVAVVEPLKTEQAQPAANEATSQPSNPHAVLRTYFLAQRPFMQTKAH
jgi:hypothetical protein